MPYNIAVVGATGNVGSQMLKLLEERNFPVNKIKALASRASLGKEVSFGGKILKVEALEEFDFKDSDIALFSAGSEISSLYAPRAAKAGCLVIDNTSFFRREAQIPLVVPEVNPQEIAGYKNKNIIANPNCAAIQLAVAIKPIYDLFTIKKIVLSTYQSVSGAGKDAMDELYEQTKGLFSYQKIKPQKFSKQIAFNMIPQVDIFLEDHFTAEEDKIKNEIKRIIDPEVEVIPTCVRVPSFIGHAESVYLECKKDINLDEIKKIFKQNKGIIFLEKDYVTPVEIAGKDEVFVSRIRTIKTNPKALLLWVVADNLRKGAALNAIQIAELLVKKHLKGS